MTQDKRTQNMKSSLSPGFSKNGFLDADDEPMEDIIDE
jgi:hypothetical protein